MSIPAEHRRIVLASRPNGMVTPDNFRLETVATPEPKPGQVIVRQGDVGRNLYAIWKGEAEVVHEGGDGDEQILAVLKDGDHFGEVAVFQKRRRTATVRAKTRVEVLSIGRSEAMALSSTMLPFGEVVRRRPEGQAPA